MNPRLDLLQAAMKELDPRFTVEIHGNGWQFSGPDGAQFYVSAVEWMQYAGTEAMVDLLVARRRSALAVYGRRPGETQKECIERLDREIDLAMSRIGNQPACLCGAEPCVCWTCARCGLRGCGYHDPKTCEATVVARAQALNRKDTYADAVLSMPSWGDLEEPIKIRRRDGAVLVPVKDEPVICGVCKAEIPGGWHNAGELSRPPGVGCQETVDDVPLCPADYQRVLLLVREMRRSPEGHTKKRP